MSTSSVFLILFILPSIFFILSYISIYILLASSILFSYYISTDTNDRRGKITRYKEQSRSKEGWLVCAQLPFVR